MPKAAGSGLMSTFQFRRRRFGSANLPLVLQPGKPAATADELPYYRASGVPHFVTDSSGLTIWKINGHMWAVGHDRDLLLSVQGVDDWESPEGKQRMRTLRDQAEIKAGMVAKRERGTDFHSLFVSVSLGRPAPETLAAEHAELIAAHQRLISLFTVRGFELPVVCDELQVAGSLDIIGSPRAPMTPVDRKGVRIAPDVLPGDVIVIDVKTAEKCDYMGEHALQIAPYANSVGYCEIEDPAILKAQIDMGTELWSPQAKRDRIGEFHRTPHGARTDVGLIFHASSAGTEAHLHWLNLAEGYEAAKHAMTTRKWHNRLPQLCSPAEPPDLLKVLEGVTSLEEGRELYRLHRDVWTPAHTAAVQGAVAGQSAEGAA